MYKLCVVLFCFVLCSCQNQEAQQKVIWQNEIDTLSSLDDKRNFLEEIYRSILSSYQYTEQFGLLKGKDSKEFKKQLSSFETVKRRELKKVDLYLNTHGYPRIMELGAMAAYAPYYTVANITDLDVKRKYFTYLYDAYVFGDITVDQFYNYLSDMYYLDKGVVFEYKPWIGSKKLIDEMLKELDLE